MSGDLLNTPRIIPCNKCNKINEVETSRISNKRKDILKLSNTYVREVVRVVGDPDDGVCECIDPANRCFGVVWCVLTEDWTNDWGKWINLNSGFIERVLHKRCIGIEIAVVVSRRCGLSWMLKVCVVESLRLGCLLVCGNSTSRRWGWSLYLVQVLGVAVWSGCRCCWRLSMVWTHWLERLDDRCSDCAVLWFNRGGGDVALKCWC